jgi:hypothetical protein
MTVRAAQKVDFTVISWPKHEKYCYFEATARLSNTGHYGPKKVVNKRTGILLNILQFLSVP